MNMCAFGAHPPYIAACENDAAKGSDFCTTHRDNAAYIESLVQGD